MELYFKREELKMIKNGKSIHGLSAKSYTDQHFWETECNTVLADGWLFVGFVHEFLNSGDVIPISIAGKPILLIKNNKFILSLRTSGEKYKLRCQIQVIYTHAIITIRFFTLITVTFFIDLRIRNYLSC